MISSEHLDKHSTEQTDDIWSARRPQPTRLRQTDSRINPLKQIPEFAHRTSNPNGISGKPVDRKCSDSSSFSEHEPRRSSAVSTISSLSAPSYCSKEPRSVTAGPTTDVLTKAERRLHAAAGPGAVAIWFLLALVLLFALLVAAAAAAADPSFRDLWLSDSPPPPLRAGPPPPGGPRVSEPAWAEPAIAVEAPAGQRGRREPAAGRAAAG